LSFTGKQKAGLRRLFALSETAYFCAGAADWAASVAGTAETAASVAGTAEATAASVAGAVAGATGAAAFSPQADKDKANRAAINAERFIFFPIEQ